MFCVLFKRDGIDVNVLVRKAKVFCRISGFIFIQIKFLRLFDLYSIRFRILEDTTKSSITRASGKWEFTFTFFLYPLLSLFTLYQLGELQSKVKGRDLTK
jgi:hypothetical protein